LQHSPLIEKYLSTLQALQVSKQAPMLDLACGHGRNGLYLVENNVAVTFADVNGEALEEVEQSLKQFSTEKQKIAQCWHVDFELENFELENFAEENIEFENTKPLHGKHFAAVMVFRYLHRPLFEQIKAAIVPGGMIIYETFTEQQAQFGRPKNPDFLLKPTELEGLFADWEILHSFEGVVNTTQHNNTQQAIAQIVAIKPD
jgi:SAM-dependent methyltransferase